MLGQGAGAQAWTCLHTWLLLTQSWVWPTTPVWVSRQIAMGAQGIARALMMAEVMSNS